MDYWRECVMIGLEEAGLEATDDQIDAIADTVKVGFENYGMAHGYDAIRCESEESRELKKMKVEAEKQRVYMATTDPCHYCNDGTTKDGWGRPVKCSRCDENGRIKKSWMAV